MYLFFVHFARSAISLFAALFVLSTAVLAQDGDEDVIAVDSSLVVLNVSIKDPAGNHVSGLRRDQFRVFEDGIEQQISFFAAEETPFAAVILLDTSGSMGRNVTLARAAAIRFLEGLRESDTAAIYRFDSRVVEVRKFSSSRDLPDKFYELRADGTTALYDAVFKAAELLAQRPEKRRAIVVLSDGADTQSGRSAERALKAAMAANAVIYTVDMTPENAGANVRQVNRGVLKNFAEKTGGTFVETPGGARMREAFEQIVEELGVQYTLGYVPLNEEKDGKWRGIELRVARPRLTVRTRQGYSAEKTRK